MMNNGKSLEVGTTGSLTRTGEADRAVVVGSTRNRRVP
jgi:hypothetical protein